MTLGCTSGAERAAAFAMGTDPTTSIAPPDLVTTAPSPLYLAAHS